MSCRIVFCRTDIQNNCIFPFCYCIQEISCRNLIFIFRQTCKITVYLFIKELLCCIFYNSISCAKPTGTIFCSHTAREIVCLKSHHSCNRNGLRSGLSAVTLENNWLVSWKFCQCFFHSFAKWDISGCSCNMRFQVIIF